MTCCTAAGPLGPGNHAADPGVGSMMLGRLFEQLVFLLKGFWGRS